MKEKERNEKGLQHGPHHRGRGAEGQYGEGDERSSARRRDTFIADRRLGVGLGCRGVRAESVRRKGMRLGLLLRRHRQGQRWITGGRQADSAVEHALFVGDQELHIRRHAAALCPHGEFMPDPAGFRLDDVHRP